MTSQSLSGGASSGQRGHGMCVSRGWNLGPRGWCSPGTWPHAGLPSLRHAGTLPPEWGIDGAFPALQKL